MKTVGRIATTYMDVGGELVSHIIWKDRRIGSEIEKLPDKDLAVELKEIGKSRSLNQNALLWELIGRICKDENAQTDDEWEMYLYLLREAKADYTYVKLLASTENKVRKKNGVRELEVLNYETDDDGIQWCNCRLYYGSSQMTVKEMNRLLDCTKMYAENLGIPTGDLI